jgi:solute carrier family 39 (zinc transporter), member 1/2/3
MVAIYSLTCPLGVAIGLGIAESYDPESKVAIAVQVMGCINHLES